MNTANPAALLRSLIVYAVCIPLAMVVGYMLTNPLDYQSLGFVGAVAALLVFPLLMKWHYPLLIFSISFPATLFFLPGHPDVFIFMTVVSLGISVVERILDRSQPSLPSTPVRWPLFALMAVIFLTAKLTGGFGLRSMGSDVYGGKKYVTLFIGILSFFAVTARPIPKKQANLYILLFFAGGFFSFIQDLYAYTPSPLHFIYMVFPPSPVTDVELGRTRLAGVSSAAGAVFMWMLARHGFRGCFLTAKLWRQVLMGLMIGLIFLGGFRNNIIGVMILLSLLFCMEKLYRTGAMLVVVMAGMLGGALLVPLAPHLPYTFQRALAFLPLDIDPDVEMDAEGSTEWRLEIWKAILPEVPKYLLLGKGYSFSAETFNESMGANATFHKSIDAADNPLALSSDFHSGPLSVVIPFGIWGVLAWLWFWAAGCYVIWRNYRYGDPALRHINVFLFASFISSCFSFLFIFGSFVEDVGHYGCLFGLSLALNHGVMGPRSFPKVKPAPLPEPAAGRRALPGRPPLPALLGR